MDLGFETIGNATLICHDHGPVLVTDPWLSGSAYFGSWGLSHAVPEEQLDAIRRAPYVWLSHGHPDHLHGESLAQLRDRLILLPDAVGGRIHDELTRQGFRVRVLPDRTWVGLSPRIKVLCIADCNQDGILLVSVGGKLVVDLNDASDRGWGRFVKKTIAAHRESFLLRLSGFGDADMIHYLDGNGQRIDPMPQRKQVGREIAGLLREYGARYFIPFSSMHRYQRTDSAWANQYLTGLTDYPVGFDGRGKELLPPFVRVDCLHDRLEPIAPAENPHTLVEPAALGDAWDEPLESDEAARAARYFRAIDHLPHAFDFVTLEVGGRDHHIALCSPQSGRGIRFAAPRQSLMAAIDNEVFDDLLIGNFMKTTLIGRGLTDLYPDFTPYVAKYADNGRAKSEPELHHYFEHYRRRAPLDFLRYQLEAHAKNVFRRTFPADSRISTGAKRLYRALRERG